MKKEVVMMHSRRWKCVCRATGSDYWQYVLNLDSEHAAGQTSSETDSLLTSAAQTVSEVDEISDLI